MNAENVYYYFRKAQSESKNRGFRMPKDFESHLENKFNKKNREFLLKITDAFNTKWGNVDPYRYFQCGFELLKTFSYLNFFDKRVLNLYIQRDKNIKREMSDCKKEIVNSIIFIKNYMKENEIVSISDYFELKENYQKIIVNHYLKNRVSKFFIVWMMVIGKLKFSDGELAFMPYISDQYREIRVKLDEMGEFLRKIQRKL